MRKLIGNPIVVALLVIIAFITVSQNIVTPITQDRQLRMPIQTVDSPLSIEGAAPMHSDVEWDQVGWPELINRDPFRATPK